MHPKRFFVVFSLLTALSLIMNGQTAVKASTSPFVDPVISKTLTAKIEPVLLSQLEAGNPVDFIAHFAPQADLSAAYSMDWKRRGEFVYQSLLQAADVQEIAKGYLDRRGLAYQTFLAGNELYVFQGRETVALELARQAEISEIRLARTYPISPFLSVLRSFDLPIQPPEGLTWPVAFTKADQFWDQFGVQGDGIVVAGIDTGVQWDHEALFQAYKCSSDPDNPTCWYDPGTIDCIGTGGGPCDTSQHGTATMGPMVADDDPALTYEIGMAPGAQWIACLGCPNGACSDYDLNACADWIIAPGGDPGSRPDIVNNSWGGAGNNDWFQSKILVWEAAGIFPTFPSGGSGPLCGTVGSPGDYSEVFTSGAIDETGTISSFSSRGPSPFGVTKPNIASPGVDIWTTVPNNDWANFSGSSFSSAYSAGAVALLWSCNPGMKGDIFGTFQVLQENASYIEDLTCGGEPGQYNNVYGWGNLDILAAGQVGCSTFLVSLDPDSLAGSGEPGEQVIYSLTLTNIGTEYDTYDIVVTGVDEGWIASAPTTISASPYDPVYFDVTVTVPLTEKPPDSIAVTAYSQIEPILGQDTSQIETTMDIVRGVQLDPESSFGSSPPETLFTYTLIVSNTGNIEDTYTVEITGVDVENGWSVIQPFPLTIPAHTSSNLGVAVLVPPGFDTPPDEITITVISTSDATVWDSSTITTAAFIYQLFLPVMMKQ